MSEEITSLLLEWNGGNREALDRLMPLVHDELRRLAHHYMSGERADIRYKRRRSLTKRICV